MKFTTTPDQDYILSVLRETKAMRKSQAQTLLGKLDGGNDERYIVRCLEQLRHMRKIFWQSDEVFTLKALWAVPADAEMLSAADIMLDLTDIRVHTISSSFAQYKLCFMSEQKDGIGNYAVVVVRPGTESMITATLKNASPDERIIIFLLSTLSQAEGIKTSLPHFFAMYDNGIYHYFSGGG
jgi:hypothetical protein